MVLTPVKIWYLCGYDMKPTRGSPPSRLHPDGAFVGWGPQPVLFVRSFVVDTFVNVPLGVGADEALGPSEHVVRLKEARSTGHAVLTDRAFSPAYKLFSP